MYFRHQLTMGQIKLTTDFKNQVMLWFIILTRQKIFFNLKVGLLIIFLGILINIFIISILFIISNCYIMEPKNEDSIQVFIRVRPGQQDDSLVAFTDSQIRLDKNQFAFDKIFPPAAAQSDIFDAVGKKLLTHTLDGYNACVFVYGQTGSGKTYTMIGQNNGLMQGSFTQLFERIYNMPNAQCNITCSYFEIYNEQIIDLLDLKKDKKLNIRQDSKRGVFVENLAQQPAFSPNKLLECLSTGMKNRHVGETLMNRQSSRSHSIFTIALSLKTQIEGKKVLKTPKLHFVDLAGSERQKMTAASGDRLKQAGNINKSLTTLGMVINALTSEKHRNHIPYRDSKLTNLLRDSLGGNSKTFIIATISCSMLCFQQTLSTLNFANRAKMVKVKAQINEQSLSTNIETYKDQIKKLRAEITKLKSEKNTPTIQTRQIFKSAEKKMIESRNYDEKFQEINNKISVISQHLISNPISPTLESLIDHLEKMKVKKDSTPMVEQTLEEMPEKNQQEDEDVFIDYLNNNNQLLHQIHTKIDEYIEIKGQLRNIAYNEQMNIASLKTPSKFERQQYEEMLSKREEEIVELYDQIKKLNEELTDHSIKLKQMNRDFTQNSIQIEEKQIAMNTIRNSLFSLENEAMILRTMLAEANTQKEHLEKRQEQLKKQCEQNKQLYIYSQEKFNTENEIRKRMQKSLQEKMIEIEELEVQFLQKMQDTKEKYEEKQQELIQEIQVLTESVQFNKKLITQFKHKLDTEKESLSTTIKKLKQTQNVLQQTQHQLEQKTYELSELTHEYNEYKNKANAQYEKIKQSLTMSINNYNEMCQKYENLEKSKEQEISEYCLKIKNSEEDLVKKMQTIQQIQQKYREQQQKNKEKTSEMKENYELQIRDMRNKMVQQLEEHQQTMKFIEDDNNKQKFSLQQLSFQHKMSIQEKDSLWFENMEIKKALSEKEDEIKSIKSQKDLYYSKFMANNSEYEQRFKELTRQNYKLKTRMSDNADKPDSQLLSKVQFYEQKFKMMSMEYQRATEKINKLKEKELNQKQKISFYEENQKNSSLTCKSNQEEQLKKELVEENKQLKFELQILKQETTTKETVNLKINIEKQRRLLNERQQAFKNMIVSSLQRQNSAKENVRKDKTVGQLLQDWERVEEEKRKQFQAVVRGIKKQQRLRNQNSLIEKQNGYLTKKIQNIMGFEIETGPKKRVKLENQENQ